jgi:hypothetical protein
MPLAKPLDVSVFHSPSVRTRDQLREERRQFHSTQSVGMVGSNRALIGICYGSSA